LTSNQSTTLRIDSTFIGKINLQQIITHYWHTHVGGWQNNSFPCNAFSWIQKDDDVGKTIQLNMVGYTKAFKFMWDAHDWNFESIKST
jgi:hypothetical protein